ncbi:MAG: VPDSG-CTERM sorting domain-containing protein [Chthoniobacterales bacterium]|nr:VPDSG-CTERM sorting domain-containing protein [Chthoniobacterales bacterium]
MKISNTISTALLAAAALALSGHTLQAVPLIPTFSFHENGNGQLELPLLFGGGVIPLPGTLMSDPGPGGLTSALTFTAHPRVAFPAGDVLLDASGHVSDILRFNPATSSLSGLTQLIFFYSNDHGGLLADTGLPSAMYENTVTIQESQSGPTIYTPTMGQPGFSTDSPLGDSFHIFSTPDTGSTLLMFGAGVGFLALARRKILGGSKLNRSCSCGK